MYEFEVRPVDSREYACLFFLCSVILILRQIKNCLTHAAVACNYNQVKITVNDSYARTDCIIIGN